MSGDLEPTEPGFEPTVTLPDTSLAIPRDKRPDMFPIRVPVPAKPIRRPSLAHRRRRRLTGGF
jgi:hypothetical protein